LGGPIIPRKYLYEAAIFQDENWIKALKNNYYDGEEFLNFIMQLVNSITGVCSLEAKVNCYTLYNLSYADLHADDEESKQYL